MKTVVDSERLTSAQTAAAAAVDGGAAKRMKMKMKF